MWYHGKMLYLFVEDGVYLSIKDYPSTSFRTQVWTLVDVDEGQCVPEFLAVQNTKHMIIFTSSPKEERWHCLTKTTAFAIAIMNPWTKREISEVLAHSLALQPSIFELTLLFCVAPLSMDLQATTKS